MVMVTAEATRNKSHVSIDLTRQGRRMFESGQKGNDSRGWRLGT